MGQRLAVGMDVGSTTVKAVVCDASLPDYPILWSDYQRHETRQPEKVMEFMQRIEAAYPGAEFSVFITGSGAGPLKDPLHAKFVQEVNAVTLAVQRLHPDVGSVIELGGQDAKIIIFRPSKDNPDDKQAVTSMNDKCASGTGATIDKCLLKVGMKSSELTELRFDASALHHVAAKCGVFAETDIVNLIKSGIPAPEILNSLADAIVHQNLSVLTRGNTLRPKVLLLGGPNTYLKFLVDAWRLRIPETWDSRGFDWPREIPIEELVFVPKDAQYYAAFGAVVYGLTEGDAPVYTGVDDLQSYLTTGRGERLAEVAGPPLAKTETELDIFLRDYTLPPFVQAKFQAGTVVRGIIGLDGGSTSTKAVLVDHDTGDVLLKTYRLSGGNPIQDTKEILLELRTMVSAQGAKLEVTGFGATGYAANVLEESLQADANIVETVAHLQATVRFIPDADVVCDIGGQDIKVLFLRDGRDGREVKDFKLSNQCSAGNGMLLQAMADQFGVPLTSYADTAFKADIAPKFSYGCAVFLDADRVNFQKEGFSSTEMLAGLAQVLPKNVWQYVVNVPRLAEFGRVFVLQGGTQRNLAAVKAQVDYIKARVPDAKIVVHPHCGEAGAIGAAMETRRVVLRNGKTRWIGLDAAIGIEYTSTTDESTRCHFCANECTRTFVDTKTPEGRTSRYISGFSCEKGTVESKESLKTLQIERNAIRKQYPNLLEEEADLLFRHFYVPAPMPAAGSPKDDFAVEKRASWSRFIPGAPARVLRKALQRGFQRSGVDLSGVKVGMPRVLNMWTAGPFFRTYFEALGMPRENVVFSPPTGEEMWNEGGRYGSIDPCFPSKVIQAHVHELITHAHTSKRRGPLNYIFYPCLTHMPSWIEGAMDNASCPIVAGSPNVVKAAFTKETDFFAKAGIEWLDPALSFIEPNLMKRELFKLWGPRLGVTEDESDFAVDQGFEAQKALDRILETKGRAILDQCERDGKIALLVVGRPYHADPGLNHSIPEEFQVRGYPVLGIRSIPKDPAWLAKYFGPGENPLDIRDVWPENYSVNSAQKVWAVRLAARHPNLSMLDLSSFKCGHDAPTYGIIERVTNEAKAPHFTLHDLDANKPGGSILIRVKTAIYQLKRVEEALGDQKLARVELARRVAEKRAELVASRMRKALEVAADAK